LDHAKSDLEHNGVEIRAGSDSDLIRNTSAVLLAGSSGKSSKYSDKWQSDID